MCARARASVFGRWTPDTLLSKRNSAFILGILVYVYIYIYQLFSSFSCFCFVVGGADFSSFFLLITRRSCLGRGSGEDEIRDTG